MRIQLTMFGFMMAGLSQLSSAEIRVAPGESIQAAIDSARSGDVIRLEAGTYRETIDYRGKELRVRGVGAQTVIDGGATGTVVRFASGEGRGAVLESVKVTGGQADDGGGIFISNASPRIQRVVIFENIAQDQGAGVYVAGRDARPEIRNCVLAYNLDPRPLPTSDAHQIFVDSGSSARITNNTFVRGNGNAILVQGSRNVTDIFNNLIVANGSILPNGNPTGRGICDFSGSARIQNNLFFRNRRAAILTGTLQDFRLVTAAELSVDESRFRNNLDGNPGFMRFPQRVARGNFRLRSLSLRSDSPARNAGIDAPRFQNRDGTRNTLGHTGGRLGWN